MAETPPSPTPAPTPLTADALVAAFAAAGVTADNAGQIVGGLVALYNALLTAGLTPQQFGAVAASQVRAAHDQRTAQAAQLQQQISGLQSQLAALTA